MVLILHDYCPSFCPKPSDTGIKTSVGQDTYNVGLSIGIFS